eukprot:2341253-Pleurochrysis_carterae.AAC.1
MKRSDLGRAPHIKDKVNDMEGVPAVPDPSGMDMAGTPEVSPSRDARPFKVREDAYSGLLARVFGSPDPRAMKASRSSRVGSKDKGHLKSVSAVHGSSGLDMAGAFDESPSRDARPLE